MTLSFNNRINRNQVITDFIGTGQYWYFNNGQYGEKTEYMVATEYTLAYHYDRVYVSQCTVHGSAYGSRTGSMQSPLTCYKDEKVLSILKMIFEADKKAGIIDEPYVFQ